MGLRDINSNKGRVELLHQQHNTPCQKGTFCKQDSRELVPLQMLILLHVPLRKFKSMASITQHSFILAKYMFKMSGKSNVKYQRHNIKKTCLKLARKKKLYYLSCSFFHYSRKCLYITANNSLFNLIVSESFHIQSQERIQPKHQCVMVKTFLVWRLHSQEEGSNEDAAGPPDFVEGSVHHKECIQNLKTVGKQVRFQTQETALGQTPLCPTKAPPGDSKTRGPWVL